MIPLKDDSEFQRLLEGLANDIIDAHIHFKLYKDLLDASNEFPLVMTQSNTFWSVTLKSHLNTSLYMLYMKKDDTITAYGFNGKGKAITYNSFIKPEDH